MMSPHEKILWEQIEQHFDFLDEGCNEHLNHTEIRPPTFGELFPPRHRTFRWRLAFMLTKMAGRIDLRGASAGHKEQTS